MIELQMVIYWTGPMVTRDHDFDTIWGKNQAENAYFHAPLGDNYH